MQHNRWAYNTVFRVSDEQINITYLTIYIYIGVSRETPMLTVFYKKKWTNMGFLLSANMNLLVIYTEYTVLDDHTLYYNPK